MPDRPAPQYRFWGSHKPIAEQLRVKDAAASGEPAQMKIYGPIDDWGAPFGVSADEFGQALAQLGDVKAIDVHIHSPGGIAFEGVAIMNQLRQHPAQINAIIDGLCASAASVVAMGADTVTMVPGAQLMIHDASGLCIGNSTDMETMRARLDSLSQNIADQYAAKAGGDPADWRAAMQPESWYTADEAVAAGLADRVLPAKNANTPDAAPTDRFDLSIFAHAGREQAPAPFIPVATVVGSHSTATDTGAWDAGANEKRLDSPMALSTAKKVYAWYDGGEVDGGQIAKSACKFPHHFVSSDGTPGAASTKACQAGIAVLNGGRGGANIPDSDRQGVYNHLAKHLRDADIEPAPLDSAPQTPAASADGPTETQGRSVAVEFTDEQLNTMRQQLGLPEDADAAAIVAAQAEALNEAAESDAAAPKLDPKAVKAALEAEGFVVMSKAKSDALTEQAEQGAQARAKQLTDERDELIEAAMSAGKISRSDKSRESWEKEFARDPETAKADLESLPARFPVSPVAGYAGHDGSVGNDAEPWSEDEADALAGLAGIPKGALR